MQGNLIEYIGRLNDYRKRSIPNKQFIIVIAIVVGALCGLAAAAIKSLTFHLEELLQHGFQWKYKTYFYVLFPMAGIFLTLLFIKLFIRKSKFETGLSPLLHAISEKSSRLPAHNIYSQIVTAAITVGFGGSAGLESPIVTSGASIGSTLGRWLGLSYREVTLLLACGAASAIAGAFNSPIAGVVFAIELLLPEFSIPIFIPLLLSSATAAVTARLFYNEQLFFLITEGWKLQNLIYYIPLAVTVAIVSVYFNHLYYKVDSVLGVLKNKWGRAAVGGLMLGLLVFLCPTLYGDGYITLKHLLDGDYNSLLQNSIIADVSDNPFVLIGFTVFTIGAKSLATLLTLKSGGNGGTFAPSLFIGGLIGFLIGYTINLSGYAEVNVANFIAAGMAAALSGIMHAPLTGIFLIAEITGGYSLIVPLMISSAISYMISRSALPHNMYTKHLAEKGQLLTHDNKDATILHMMRLKYVVETDYPIIYITEPFEGILPTLLKSKRNIYPVLDKENQFLGLVYAEELFQQLLTKKEQESLTSVNAFIRPAPSVINVNDPIEKVLNIMDQENIWVLPVLHENGTYLGFVSKTSIFNKYRRLLMRQAEYLV